MNSRSFKIHKPGFKGAIHENYPFDVITMSEQVVDLAW